MQQAAPDPLKDHPRYRKEQPLSSGSFGFVHLCKNLQSGETVAIKFLERGERVNKYVETEVLNHRMLRHPHVIEFKEVFLTPEYICIVMEYASGGNLFGYVQRAIRLKEPAARWFFQQLIIGLDYCHRRGVVNRDIKLENTLLTMVPGLPLPLLKICDFGYSKAHFMSAPKSKVGTLAYMAPEVIRATDQYAGQAADIWSCGVMLYVMLFGAYPFESSTSRTAQTRMDSMMQRILRMEWSIPADVEVSPECRDLLCKLLVGDPRHRLTMAQIQQHPWFLTNLPPDALAMNDNFLAHTDYTGVQSEENIKRVLASAAIPAPSSKFAYTGGAGADNEFDDIDQAIDGELVSPQGAAPRGGGGAAAGAVSGQQPKPQTVQVAAPHLKPVPVPVVPAGARGTVVP